MRRYIFTFISCLLFTAAFSQGFEEVLTGGSTNTDRINGVALDDAGNRYIAGSFRGQVVMGDDTVSASLQNVFVAKLNESNDYQWAHQISSSSVVSAVDVELDMDSNVYVLLTYRQSTTIPNTSGTDITVPAPSNTTGTLIIKFDKDGVYQDHIAEGGSDFISGNDIFIHDDKVYLAGAIEVSGSNNDDAFIRLTTFNNYSGWSAVAHGPGDDGFNSITIDDSSYIHVAGQYADSLIFDGADSLYTPSGEAGIIASFDSMGMFMHQSTFEGNFSTDIASINNITFGNGNYYAAMDLSNSVELDFQTTVTAIGSQDQLIMKLDYDTLGFSLDWYEQMESSSSGSIITYGLQENNGGVIALGSFFGTSTINSQQYTPGSNFNIFFLNLTSSGNYNFVEDVGNSLYSEFGYALAVHNQSAFLGGSYTGTVDFGSIQVSSTFTTTDFFLAEYSLNVPAEVDLDYTTGTYCEGDSIEVEITKQGQFNPGNMFIVQLSDLSGSFSSPTNVDTLQGISGATVYANIPMNMPEGADYQLRVTSTDPSYTSTGGIVFEIASIPDVQTISGPQTVTGGDTSQYSVTSNTGATYDWIIDNGTKISGSQTAQIEVAWIDQQNIDEGSVHMIETSADGCVADTALLEVQIDHEASMGDVIERDITLYPNPSSDKINIRLENMEKGLFDVRLVNAQGQTVFQEELRSSQLKQGYSLPVNNLKPGVYLLNLQNSKGVTNKHFIVK